jgi:hypothetical protein
MKKCRKEYHAEYYQKHKPSPEMRKFLAAANREKVAEKNRKYREKKKAQAQTQQASV